MTTLDDTSSTPLDRVLPIPLTNEERDRLQAYQPGYGSRNAVEVAFNLVNATVGAGIIGCTFVNIDSIISHCHVLIHLLLVCSALCSL
jgi:sodium-coupled neutral amino acid transporter 11